MKKVVVGMSGGIDSLAAALLLQQEGYDVIGVTLELWKPVKADTVQDICRTLGIPLYFQEGKELFRERVVRDFTEAYCTGRTPSPCCLCNGFVKWELLKRAADQFQAEYIATGHYVRIQECEGKYYIRRGVDAVKDQSYFLWQLSQEILSCAVTPLGGFTKKEVRKEIAARGYIEMIRRKESMGVCFLEGKDYRDFLLQNEGYQQKPGDIVNREGAVIGRHTGLLNYTIGQKRGMPVDKEGAWYVAEMDTTRNRIVADRKNGLYVTSFDIGQGNWVSPEDIAARNLTVKVRGIGLNPEGYARVESLGNHCFRVYLSGRAWAVAPGQPVAFYRDDLLAGGGIVK